MPKWIEDRVKHILKSNPDMEESTAWAIATQQAHATNKSKGYGTTKGKKKAKKKYKKKPSSYEQRANPKRKKKSDIVFSLLNKLATNLSNSDPFIANDILLIAKTIKKI